MSESIDSPVPFNPGGLASLGISPAPSAATLHRWRLRGISGVRISTFMRGGRRYVTRAAVEEFFARVTEARDGTSSSAVTPAVSADSLRLAEDELDADGIA